MANKITTTPPDEAQGETVKDKITAWIRSNFWMRLQLTDEQIAAVRRNAINFGLALGRREGFEAARRKYNGNDFYLEFKDYEAEAKEK